MKLSIATLPLPGDMHEKLFGIANAGFAGIDVNEQEIVAYGQTVEELSELLSEFSLEVASFRPLPDMGKVSLPLGAADLKRLNYRLGLMKALKTNKLILDIQHLSVQDDVDQLEALKSLEHWAKEHQIIVIVQPRTVEPADANSDELIVQLSKLKSSHLLLAWDCLNQGEKLHGEALNAVGHLIVADAQIEVAQKTSNDGQLRLLPGEGSLDLVGQLDPVFAVKYQGWLSLELSGHRARRSNARALAMDANRALKCLLEKCKNGNIQPLPTRVEVERAEFVEFAATGDEAENLRAEWHLLGFRKTGIHVDKNVELWRQNNINLVLNTEEHGFAHSCAVMHGACVCDIGFLVDDAQNARERAKALGIKPFGQFRHQGELDIPAVRGVGGSALHFLDGDSELSGVWSKEFKPVHVSDEPTIGLKTIDHIAQVVRTEELPSALGFYESLFHFHKTSRAQIREPGGVVQSVALESENGAVKITLNANDTHRTFAGRFATDRMGASVQHLAFSTDDIFATAKALSKNGFPILEIGGAYYDELGARFDLSDKEIKNLASLNLFYDRDEKGHAYCQLYSRPKKNGFFFEIVQRDKDYAGFGARNALYRTIALKRAL